METFPIIVLHHILIVIQHGVQMMLMDGKKASKTSTIAKHPNSYGKKAGSQMDSEKAALVKMPVNIMAWMGFS